MKKGIIAIVLMLLCTPLTTQSAQAKKTRTSSKLRITRVSKKKTSKKINNKVKVDPSWLKTYSNKSYVILNRTSRVYTSTGRRTKTPLKKNAKYRVYYVKYTKDNVFYATKNNKVWLLGSATRGKVYYRVNMANTMLLETDRHGRLTYHMQTNSSIMPMVVKINSYVYNNRGLLKNGRVTLIRKGAKLTAYSKHHIRGYDFYLTNRGYIKAHNLQKTKK